MKLTVGGLLLASACLFLAAWLVIAWVDTACSGSGSPSAPCSRSCRSWSSASRRRSECSKFEEQFPEAIDLIARALRAGHAFTTGLALVAEEAPQPVAGEFRLLYDQQNFGMPLGDALKAFAERLPLLDARFFVTAVLTQRESGGNLSEILGNLANVIRERFKVKRQVRVHLRARPHHGLGAFRAAAVARRGDDDHVADPHHDAGRGSDGHRHDHRRAGPPDRRDADHPEARQHRVLTRKTTMTPELMLAIGALFVSVAFAAGYVDARSAATAGAGQAAASRGRPAPGVLATDLPLAAGELDPRLARANRFLPKSPKDMSRLQRRMARAGYRSPMAPVIYTMCELGLPLILLGALRLFSRHDAAACSSAR